MRGFKVINTGKDQMLVWSRKQSISDEIGYPPLSDDKTVDMSGINEAQLMLALAPGFWGSISLSGKKRRGEVKQRRLPYITKVTSGQIPMISSIWEKIPTHTTSTTMKHTVNTTASKEMEWDSLQQETQRTMERATMKRHQWLMKQLAYQIIHLHPILCIHQMNTRDDRILN